MFLCAVSLFFNAYKYDEKFFSFQWMEIIIFRPQNLSNKKIVK